ITTQPMEYEPWPSKTGRQVVPAFSVSQTPPDAAATNQREGRRGSTASEEMRPEYSPGPMERKRSAESAPGRRQTNLTSTSPVPLPAGKVSLVVRAVSGASRRTGRSKSQRGMTCTSEARGTTPTGYGPARDGASRAAYDTGSDRPVGGPNHEG